MRTQANDLTMKISVRRLSGIAGGVLALLGIVFVGQKLLGFWDEIELETLRTSVLILCVALSVVYALSNLLLAHSYRSLLLTFGQPVGQLAAIKLFGISQLAKYVPGNIFHLASRQAIGAGNGLSNGALAKASFWELALLTLSSACFVPLFIPTIWPSIPVLLAAILAVISLVAFLGTLNLILGIKGVVASLGYIAFFMTSGLLFAILLTAFSLSDIGPLAFVGICAAFIVAFLAGFIMPGAPAGVGVRELVLVFLLGTSVPELDLLVAVILMRFITVSGDLLAYLGAIAIPVKILPLETIQTQ